MPLDSREKQKGHSPDKKSEFMLKPSDGTAGSDATDGPDAKRVNELRASAKEDVLSMASLTPGKVLTADERLSLFSTLKGCFISNPERYQDIQFSKVQDALEAAGNQALYGLFKMEENKHEVGVTSVEKGGKKGFRFDSCSKESPKDIRDVNYFQAENIAEKDWGVPLMPPEVFDELRIAEIITNKTTWDHLKTPTPGTSKKPDPAWYGYADGFQKRIAISHDNDGGFRCSVWIPEA